MRKKLIMKLLFFFVTTVFLIGFLPSTSLAQKKLVILGDSLTEGLGVARESAFPALLEKKIKTAGKSWTVINAGVSGSTSASAPSRVKWLIKSKPDLLIIALGANDGLRGIDVNDTRKNLEQTIELVQKEKLKIVLIGMMMPPNYGKPYTEGYRKIFSDIAKKYKLHFIPFLLQDVAGHKELNQNDAIHPNEKGHEIIAENVYKGIKDLL